MEQAAKNAGHAVTVPFAPGRMDASPQQTDVHSFAVLEPFANGFRNFLRRPSPVSAEAWLVDRAQVLTLTAPEMTGHLEFLGRSSLRVTVFVQWVWTYVTGQRGSRLIVNHRGGLHHSRDPSREIHEPKRAAQ